MGGSFPRLARWPGAPWLVAAPLCLCLVAWSSRWLCACASAPSLLLHRRRSLDLGPTHLQVQVLSCWSPKRQTKREGNCEKPFALNNSICCQDCCLTRNLLCEREAEACLASLPVCLLQEGARSQAARPGASLCLPQHPPPLEPLQRLLKREPCVYWVTQPL